MRPRLPAPQSRPRCRARLRAERSPKPSKRIVAWPNFSARRRELGKLGHRPHRRTRPGKANGAGIELLTGRDLQVARLVVNRKTNPQIAAELFLSQKTVATHLRNIFHKMGVTTLTALARDVERTNPTANPRTR
jgi:DNA-binding NarL/FixJ family response regulator